MIPVQFDYAAPESLETAVKLLKENEGAQILGGGHSLIAEMTRGGASPSLLVDLRKITALEGISLKDDGGLQIGAMTTYSSTAEALKVKENYYALAEAASSIGDAQIRNWGTIGDIFAYRDMACDLLAVALALEATFNIIGSGGTRAIPADEFIIALKSRLEPDELVTSIDFPPYVAGTGSAYHKFKHPASRYTICGIAALVGQASNGTVGKCRVAVTGATAYAIRLPQVEAALSGKAPTAENIAAVAQLATEAASEELTSSDLYASAEYRVHLRGVLTERALTRAIERAGFHA
jgi:carbon-monoxide dehydrogenase medium subunit